MLSEPAVVEHASGRPLLLRLWGSTCRRGCDRGLAPGGMQVAALPRGSLVEVVPVLAAAPTGGAGELDPSRLRAAHAEAATAGGTIICSALLTAAPEGDRDDHFQPGSPKSASQASAGSCTDAGVAERRPDPTVRVAHASFRCSGGSDGGGGSGGDGEVGWEVVQQRLRDLLSCCGGALGISGDRWRDVSTVVVTHQDGQGDVEGLAAAALADLAGTGPGAPVAACVPVVQIVEPAAAPLAVTLQMHVMALV